MRPGRAGLARVVITGYGTVNPLGSSAPATLQAMAAGLGAIAPFTGPEARGLASPLAALVPGWDGAARFAPPLLSMLDRASQFALASAAEAVAMAGLAPGDFGPQSGVVMGTAAGGHGTWNEAYRAVFEQGKSRVHPFTVPRLMANAPAAQIAIAHGITGPSLGVTTACASSNHAIGLGMQLIRAGAARLVLAGGSEAMVNFGGLKAWEGLRVLSSSGCRPFCASRDGLVLGEGAGVFVLEDEAFALARGARPLAELAGFAMTTDATDMVQPQLAGPMAAISGALRDAGLAAPEIGYVNAHGTGTALNDRIEAEAIARTLGEGAAVSSTKSQHGHLIGASGAVELLAVILALRQGVIAPTIGHQRHDPGLAAIDLVLNQARAQNCQAALSNAFAFGGQNAVLALRSV